MAGVRAAAAANHALELAGEAAGWLYSVEGGEASAEVVTEKLAADQTVRKHLGAVRYSPLVLECGAGMSKAFVDWLVSTLDRKGERKDGVVVSADFDFKERSRLAFTQGLVTSIGFPALDGASKDPAKLTVGISAELTRRSPGSAASLAGSPTARQTAWLPANFRLQIDGLDCKKVVKIAPIVIEQLVTELPVGELRDVQRQPAGLVFPSLVVTLHETSTATWDTWFEEFVINGDNGEGREKSGTLEYLSSDLKSVLFRLTFSGLGIHRLSRGKGDASSKALGLVTASLYCEEIRLGTGEAKPAPAVEARLIARPGTRIPR